MKAQVCEVSWGCRRHSNTCMPCLRKPKFIAFGIGNEGRGEFKVCGVHADVVRKYRGLWYVVKS